MEDHRQVLKFFIAFTSMPAKMWKFAPRDNFLLYSICTSNFSSLAIAKYMYIKHSYTLTHSPTHPHAHLSCSAWSLWTLSKTRTPPVQYTWTHRSFPGCDPVILPLPAQTQCNKLSGNTNKILHMTTPTFAACHDQGRGEYFNCLEKVVSYSTVIQIDMHTCGGVQLLCKSN